MRNSTDQPLDVYVAVDMTCIGCGYNLRTLAVASECPECSRPVDDSHRFWNTRVELMDSRMLRDAIGMLAWVPLLTMAATLALVGLAWAIRSVVFLAPLLCSWLIFGTAFIVAAFCFIGSSFRLTRKRGHYLLLGVVVLLSLVLLVVSIWSGHDALVVLSATFVVTFSMACTSWQVRAIVYRFSSPSLEQRARTCFRIAIGASALLIVSAIVHAVVWFTPGAGFANRAVSNYMAAMLMAPVAPTVVAHSLLMFRTKTWLAEFVDMRGDADSAR